MTTSEEVSVYARLSRYTMHVEDRARFDEAADAGGAAPSVVDMLLALEGCHGAWVLSDDAPGDGPVERFSETFVSLWETRGQAEAVRDLLGPQIAAVLGGGGAVLADAPETQVLAVLAGRGA